MTARLLCSYVLACLLSPFTFAQAPVVAPVEVLVPVTTAKGVVQAQAPDGKTYPVFRLADDTPLTRRVRGVLQTSFAHQVIVLDRYARNLLLSETAGAPSASLTAPAYLLMSQEEGGFSRHGFWLEDDQGKRQLVSAGYVDLVIGEESAEDGSLEEIFSHELAHQILGELAGPLPEGPARNMHLSMTVTDDPTAFDEGYAESFQPLVRDASSNSRVREIMNGTTPSDLDRLWISRLDQQLRTDGVKRNVFIHAKALPPAALDAHTDRHHLYIEDQTSTVFLDDELRNGQQMMASEGVIATLFYRIVNDASLRNHYRAPEFYRPFLGADVSGERLQQTVAPYENANLKLFVALRRAANPIAAGSPPMVAVINAYAAAFPDEAREIYKIFLETTRGATASQDLASAFEHAAAAGRRGDISAFRPAALDAFSRLKTLLDRVTSGELRLDADLGPQVWLLNPDFKIAPALWSSDRTLPLTLNLNTASEAELMTIAGVDLVAARKIVAARRARRFFSSVDDLNDMVAPALVRQLHVMSEQMKTAAPVPRP